MKVANFSGMGRKPSDPKRDPFGEHLLQLRLAAGLSQDALAAKAGVDQRRIYAWEKTGSLANREIIPKLAAALGVTTDELLQVKPLNTRSRGPKGELQTLLEELEKLPKSSRRKAVEFMRTWLAGWVAKQDARTDS